MSYTPSLLMVEDDPDDVIFLQQALKDYNVPFKMETIMQGDLVFPYLLSCTSLPDLIILDLNLPKISGKEILKQLKATPDYQHIKVVVLTTSSSATESQYCLSLGAYKFITKPSTIEGYKEAVGDIFDSLSFHNK